MPFFVGCHEEKNKNDEHSYAFCVFKSQYTIDLMNKHMPNFEERDILLDATFKCCPFGPFNQLLLLYFRYQDKVFPFAYVLMTRKTQRAYQHLFSYINERVCSLKCKSFTSDYEVAMRNALAILFPGTRLVACWFHYSQALKRKVKQIPGFQRFLHGNEAAEEIYYKLQCLPLLPSEHILSAFQQLKKEALAIDKKKFRFFLTYFQRQWIVKVLLLQTNIHFLFVCFYCNQMFGFFIPSIYYRRVPKKFLFMVFKCALLVLWRNIIRRLVIVLYREHSFFVSFWHCGQKNIRHQWHSKNL